MDRPRSRPQRLSECADNARKDSGQVLEDPEFLRICWKGRMLVYDRGMAEIFLDGARRGDYQCNRCLGLAAAVILHATKTISDDRLREYVTDSLVRGVALTQKKRRGRDASDNAWRNACITGWLIPPLMQAGFSATRNAATEDESACSIVSKALKRVGIDLKEKAIATVWGKVSRYYDAEGSVLNK
jgi:hypothetical protein